MFCCRWNYPLLFTFVSAYTHFKVFILLGFLFVTNRLSTESNDTAYGSFYVSPMVFHHLTVTSAVPGLSLRRFRLVSEFQG